VGGEEGGHVQRGVWLVIQASQNASVSGSGSGR
jgi:hypothetical protein